MCYPTCLLRMQAMTPRIEPIVKWPGGKQSELDFIIPDFPKKIASYYEPFLGGGAVYLTIPAHIPAFVNDLSTDLINLYKHIASNKPDFYSIMENIDSIWLMLQSSIETNQETLLDIFGQYRSLKLSDIELTQRVHNFVLELQRDSALTISMCFGHDEPRFFVEARRTLNDKIRRAHKLEKQHGVLSDKDILDNLESALKSAFYTYLRYLYNYSNYYRLSSMQHSAIFYFLRENAYGAMFRFNSQGHFNIPYGGISYNRKALKSKITRMRSKELQNRLQSTVIENLDFWDFLNIHSPQKGDFVFLDPPYDTEFSSYDQNPFGREDQARLTNYLVNECKANFMLVIKSTEYILSLYSDRGLNVRPFDKTYRYTVKDRNNREVTHLKITNY
jgi:DNA adenine methylase